MATAVVTALAIHRRSARAQGLVEWVGALFLGVVLLMLGVHAMGVLLDYLAAIRNPYGLDYGEGIVWYQATLIPGPRAYAAGQDLPFIVFHYPPVYHLLARAASWFMPDMLAGGRLVSVLASLALAPLVAALVVTAGRQYGERLMARHLAIAAMAGLLVINLHAIRTWGMVMRVDMVAVALCFAGVLIAARANGRILETTVALLLCVAAAFTKQTELPGGIAIFVVTVLRKPRKGLIAGAIAGTVGLLALAALQFMTNGGFVTNIVRYNLNRYDLVNVFNVFWPERWSGIFMLVMVLAAFALLLGLWRQRAPGPRLDAIRQLLLIVKLLDPTMAARAMLLLYFGLASLMLVTTLKTGGNFNYLIDWLCMGCVLIGVLLCDLLANRGRFVLLMIVLAVGVAVQPLRQMPDYLSQAELDRDAELVRLIASATKPVASEDMTLMMRANKPIVFEPSIATELAGVGRWDERPLVEMVRSGGFAFIITTNNAVGGTDRRSAAMDAAMRVAYPRAERVGRGLWLNLPK